MGGGFIEAGGVWAKIGSPCPHGVVHGCMGIGLAALGWAHCQALSVRVMGSKQASGQDTRGSAMFPASASVPVGGV